MQSSVFYLLQHTMLCIVGIILALVYKQLGLAAFLLGTGYGLILLTLALETFLQAYCHMTGERMLPLV